VLSKVLQAALLAVPRQLLASEAAKSEAGDVGHLRAVGRPEKDPILVARLTDARTWWRPSPTAWETSGR
jgi:hypothetical protein